jgi:hypothetical protein
MYDIARAERVHRAIKNDARVVYNHAMRKCVGACNRSRSVGQFKGDSSVCIRCVARRPR